MTRSTRRRLGSFCAAVVALMPVLASCGDDDEGSSSNTTTAPAETSAPDTTEAPDTTTAGSDTSAPAEEPAMTADELYELAKGEDGTITLYSGQFEDTNKDLAEEFMAAYPDAPDVEWVTMSSADLPTRYGSERDAGNVVADVLIVDLGALRTLSEKDWIAVPSAETVPILAEYDEGFVYPYGVVGGVLPHLFTYNTDLVENVPTSYEDLLDPEWKGRLGLGDPRAQVPSYIGIYMIYKALGEEGLRQLAAQEPTWFPSATPCTAAVGAGEISLCWPAYGANLKGMQDAGAPVDAGRFENFGGATPSVAVSEGSDVPYGAALFMNFLLEERGQSIWNGPKGDASPLGSVPAYSGNKDYPAPAELPAEFVAVSLEELDEARAVVLEALGLTE